MFNNIHYKNENEHPVERFCTVNEALLHWIRLYYIVE